jgi:hypothetical protein
MNRLTALMLLTLSAAGCGGEYIVTAPDTVGTAGEEATVVVRLQRREFATLKPPVEDAAITLKLAGRSVCCAFTDEDGYAAIEVELPERPGRHVARLHHQDMWGDEMVGQAAIYALPPDRPVVLADLDSLPRGDRAGEAAAALERLAERAELVYVTCARAGSPEAARRVVDEAGYREGPVVPCPPGGTLTDWSRHEVDALAALRRRLAGLKWAVTADAGKARTFLRAGLNVLAVGGFEVDRPEAATAEVRSFDSWTKLYFPR